MSKHVCQESSGAGIKKGEKDLKNKILCMVLFLLMVMLIITGVNAQEEVEDPERDGLCSHRWSGNHGSSLEL